MYQSDIKDNKNYEGRKPVMERKDSITIERDEFVEVCAKLCAECEPIRKAIDDIPMMLLMFVMFGAELEKKLFGEEN